MSNLGYFSTGALLPNQPAVPATTVVLTNPYLQDCIVYLNANGATITAIKVNGVTTGLTTSGTFIIEANQTISITYTVATPTWVWVAL